MSLRGRAWERIVMLSVRNVVGSMRRVLATAQNGLEVIRFGGLTGGAES